MAKKRGNDLAMPNFEEDLITVIDSRMASNKPNTSNSKNTQQQQQQKQQQQHQQQSQAPQPQPQPGSQFTSDGSILMNDNEWPAATVIVGNGRRRSGGSSVPAGIRHQPSGRSRSSDHALIRRRPYNNLIDDNIIYTIDEQPFQPAALSSSQPLTKYYTGAIGGHQFPFTSRHPHGHLYDDYERTNSVNEFHYTGNSSSVLKSKPESYQPHPAHRALSDQSLRSPSYQSGHPGRVRHRSYSSYPHRRLPVSMQVNYPSEW